MLTSALGEEARIVVVVHVVLLDGHHALDAWVLHRRQDVALIDGVSVRRVVGTRLWLFKRVLESITEALALGWRPD